jgi:transposase
MSQPFTELSQAELDGLIERVKEAAEYGLALSAEDLQWLLNALLMLAQLQAEMADQDITLQKLRKLAGIVNSSEKLRNLTPGDARNKPSRRPKPKLSPKPPAEAVVHERCQHALEGLKKGQRCPACGRGTLYKYTPAVVLRISGQTPLKSTQHLLERLRCNRGVLHRPVARSRPAGWPRGADLRLQCPGADGHPEVLCRRPVLSSADPAAVIRDAGERLDGL